VVILAEFNCSGAVSSGVDGSIETGSSLLFVDVTFLDASSCVSFGRKSGPFWPHATNTSNNKRKVVKRMAFALDERGSE
jgi:hypothetical protein